MSPKDFFWGVATSAYQVEGAVGADGRTPNAWDRFAAAGNSPVYRGDVASVSADHYHHLAADLDLVAGLGVNAYRFSLSWTRLLTRGAGPVNAKGASFYDRMIDGVLARGITPMVTMCHNDLPADLMDDGGWECRTTADRFADYAETVLSLFGDRVTNWLTLNELCYEAWGGYSWRSGPPGVDRITSVLPVVHHQLLAHGAAVQVVRAAGGDHRVGFSNSIVPISAVGDDDQAAATLVDQAMNRVVLDPALAGTYPEQLLEWHRRQGGSEFVFDGDLERIHQRLDYHGLNFYTTAAVLADPEGRGGGGIPSGLGARALDRPELPSSAFGWVIEPQRLTDALIEVSRRYRIPVIVTENGVAVDDYAGPDGEVRDIERMDFIDQHLNAMHEAIARGADVIGYFHWSLLDNFEWMAGYSKRFGLVYVDFPSGARIPKRSYAYYRDRVGAARR